MPKSIEELTTIVKGHEDSMTALLDSHEKKGEWTKDEAEKAGAVAIEITKSREERNVRQTEIDQQGKQVSDLKNLMAGGSHKVGDDGSDSLAGTSLEDRRQLIEAYGLDKDNAATAGKVLFRNGKHGRYTAFDRDTVQLGDNTNPLGVEHLASPEYRKTWNHMLKQQNFSDFPNQLNQVKAETGCFGDNCGTVMNPNDYFQGGFMINPTTFLTDLQRECDDMVVMRQWASVRTIGSIAVSIPVLVKRLQSFAWGCECTPPRKSDIPEGDRLTLRLHEWTQMTGICNALLNWTSSPEPLLMEELAYDLSINLEDSYLYANGQESPLGLLNRITWKNAVKADPNKVYKIKKGTPSLDCLLRLFNQHNCPNASLLISKMMWGQLMEMKNGNGDYYFWPIIMNQGVVSGVNRPNFMGVSVFVSDRMTGDFKTADPTDRYAAVLGDGQSYWILDGPATKTGRDENIYQDRTCFVVRGYAGGGVVNEHRFTPIQVTAS